MFGDGEFFSYWSFCVSVTARFTICVYPNYREVKLPLSRNWRDLSADFEANRHDLDPANTLPVPVLI